MVKINGRPLQEDDLLVLGAVGGAVAASLAALMLYIVLHTMGRMFRRATTRRTDDAPRLQRIEQTVESIALEVERAAEAQRYSAMLLTERLPDPPARVAGPTRAEPGGRVLTPH